MSKIISSKQAAELVNDGDTIGINGFVGFSHPEELSLMLEKRFKETGHPANLTLIYGAGQGDGKTDFGLNHYAHSQMTKRVVCGHIGLAHKLSALVSGNEIEGYNFPQGVVTHLYRAIAGKKIGVVTHVGLKTFADPRVEGCKMNDKTTEDLVQLIKINKNELLLYKSLPIQVALIRGTTADEFGNITMEKEAVSLETLSLAQAARNSGGIVIAQVERIALRGSLHPAEVKIPGILVDYLVVAQKENHPMSFTVDYDPSFSGEIKVPVTSLAPMRMNERKIIARRSVKELTPGMIINLGIGMPDGIAAVALEEGIIEHIYMTVESGVIGGIPGSGMNMGASVNADAILKQPEIFDFYDGGGLDLAYLGLAQVDRVGNINVSKFNNRLVGCGGFVNITQNTKQVIFCGTFTAGEQEFEIKDGKLKILKDGANIKFTRQVEQITFSAEYARKTRQPVLYITERAVFRLTGKGLELTEIAPGVDLQKHILDKMEFVPVISKNLKLMDSRIFSNEKMEIRKEFFNSSK